MTNYVTIKAPEEAVAIARESKDEHDETWGEYLLRCADADVPRKWTEGEVRDVARGEAEGVVEEVRR